jgi:hypothetical protein
VAAIGAMFRDMGDAIPLNDLGPALGADRSADEFSPHSSPALGAGGEHTSESAAAAAPATAERAAIQQVNEDPTAAAASHADVAPTAKAAVAGFAEQHIQGALVRAEHDAIRGAATDVVNRLTQKSSFVSKIVSADPQGDARQALGRSTWTDWMPSLKPEWQKTPERDLAEHAAPEAIKWLEKQPVEVPRNALDYKSALYNQVDAAVAEFQRSDSKGNLDRTSAASDAEGFGSRSVRGINDTSKVFEAAGIHVATQTARAMYAVGTKARSAVEEAVRQNAEKALTAAMSPLLEAGGKIDRSKPVASDTGTSAEWSEDSRAVQEELQERAGVIARETFLKYVGNPDSTSEDLATHVSDAATRRQGKTRAESVAGDINEASVLQKSWQAAGAIALRVLKANAERLDTLKNAPRGLPAPAGELTSAETRFLKDVNESIASVTQRSTKAASDWVHGQPEVQREIREKSENATSQDAGDRLKNQSRILDAVHGLNFVPDPAAAGRVAPTLSWKPRTWLEAAISAGATPFMKGATYNRDFFDREMLPLLPPQLSDALQPALRGEPDKATAMLGRIPYGLSEVVADVHAHSMGYDRRQGDQFGNMLNHAHDNGRILFGSIPQYCGGAGHYSGAVPAAATMKNAVDLDERSAEDWLKVYHSDVSRAARADLSITAVNFSPNPPIKHQAFTDPAGYVRSTNLKSPVLRVAIGETTADKEAIRQQLGGEWAWNVGSEKFQDLLGLLNQTGQILLLHNDWGDHALSAKGRPAPAMQNYEHFDQIKFVFSRPEYSNLQILFAHTGIGRLVRPKNVMSTREHVIKNWSWDPETGTGKVTNQTTKRVTAAEHVHKIYELFEAVPNARVDISWNDVTQSYMDLMHSNPAGAESLVQLFSDHQQRILFGSDIVKPVNEGHYHQALMAAAPLFAEIVQRDIGKAGGVENLTEDNSAAFKILRGNYDHAMEAGYGRLRKWKEGQNGDPTLLDEMRQMQDSLRDPRASLHQASWEAFTKWAGAVHRTKIEPSDSHVVNWGPESPDFENFTAGVYPALYRDLPESTHLELDAGTQTGVGTSGGFNNDSTPRQVGAAALSAALLGAAGAGTYGLSRLIDPPGEGGVFGLARSGSTATDGINAGAFVTRALMGLGRIGYTENLRLEWEKIFEQGVVTRDGLDRYVSRVFNGSPWLGVTALQRAHIAAATEQFWANYTHLRDKPIDPASGWTEQQKFLAIHAKVGAHQSTVNRTLNLQDSSIDATDARRPQGRLLRATQLATYGVNLAVTAKWLEAGGLKEFTEAASVPEAAFRALFGLGNAVLASREGYSLAGGLLGITDTETNAVSRGLQFAGTGALAAGGVAWTADSAVAAVSNFIHKDFPDAGLDTITAVLKLAFTWFLSEGLGNEIKRAGGQPMAGPRGLSMPQVLMLGTLALSVVFGLAKVRE